MRFPGRVLVRSETLDRAAYASVVGILLMLWAAYRSWLLIPSPLSTVGPDGLLAIVEAECWPAAALRIGVLGLALVALLVLLLDAAALRRLRRPAWVLLALVIALPSIVQVWHPEEMRHVDLIYDHMERVVDDMEVNLWNLQRDWRDFQSFNVAPAARWRIDMPGFEGWTLDFLQLSYGIFVQEMLGYTNSYFNVAGGGWYVAMAGLLVLLLGIYSRETVGYGLLRADLVFAPCCFALVFGVILAPRAIAEYQDREAQHALARGEQARALDLLRREVFWQPALAYSLDYQAKLGRITQARNCVTCVESALYRANLAVLARDYRQAAAALERAASLDADIPGMRHWLGRAYTELALSTFNAGAFSSADELFVRALSFLPTDPLAWYGRSIVQTRQRDFDRAADYAGEVLELQGYVAFSRYPVHAQYLLNRSWGAYARGDAAEAHRYYSEYLTPELWKAADRAAP